MVKNSNKKTGQQGRAQPSGNSESRASVAPPVEVRPGLHFAAPVPFLDERETVIASGFNKSLDGLSKTNRGKYMSYFSDHFTNPVADLIRASDGEEVKEWRPKARLHDSRANELIDAIGDVEIRFALDVGSGDGMIAKAIREHYGCVMETDSVEHVDLPVFKYDHTVDLIILSQCLHHMPWAEQVEVLTSVFEHLSKDGLVIVKEHDVQWVAHARQLAFMHSVWDMKPEYPCGKEIYPRSAARWSDLVQKLLPGSFRVNTRKPLGFGRTFIAVFGRPSAKHSVANKRITVHSESLQKEVEGLGFKTRRAFGMNAHERSAATRTQLLSIAFTDLKKKYPKKTKLALLSDWGRLKTFLEHDDNLWECLLSQSPYTARDHMRRNNEPVEENLRECKVAIMHDQYDGMTPGDLDHWFDQLAPGASIFVFLIPMFGTAGVLSDMVYHDDGNLVTCAADMSQSYFHSSEDFPRWLNKGHAPASNGRYLHSVLYRQFNEKCVFQVMRLEANVPRHAAGVHYPSLIHTETVKVSRKRWHWWSWGNKYVEDEVQLSVHSKIYRMYVRKYCRSKTNAWNTSTLSNTLSKAFENDVTWQRFAARFEDVALKVENDTADAIMYAPKPTSIARLEELSSYAAPFERRQERILKGNGPAKYVSWWYRLYRKAIFNEDYIDGVFVPGEGSIRNILLAFALLFLLRKLMEKLGIRTSGAGNLEGTCLKVIIPSGVKETAGPWYIGRTFGGVCKQVAFSWYLLFENTFKAVKAGFFERWKDMRPLRYVENAVQAQIPSIPLKDLTPLQWIVATLPVNPVYVFAEWYVFRKRKLLSVILHVLFRTDLPVYSRVMSGFVGAFPYWMHVAWNISIWFGTEFGAVVALLTSFASFGTVLTQSSWSVFAELYNNEKYLDALEVVGSCAIPIGSRLLSTRAHPSLHTKIEIEPLHRLTVKHFGIESEHVPEDPRVPMITPVLITNSVLYCPTPGLNSLYNALKCRNMQSVPEPAPLDEWTSIWDQLCRDWPEEKEGLDFDDLQEWADHYSDSRRTALANDLIQRINEGKMPYDWHGEKLGSLFSFPYIKLGMFAKTNESLILKVFNGMFGVKARTIITLPLVIQIHTQPWVRRASKLLKQRLMEPFHVDGTEYWFSYAAGMNSADLDNWKDTAIAFAKKGGVAGIFMGDDSLVIDGRYDCLIVECDYSHFDQSQSKHLIEFDEITLQTLGVPSSVTDILSKVAGSRSKSKRISSSKSTEMAFTPGFGVRKSGASNTGVSNTINNFVAMIIAGERRYSLEIFDFIGFKTKIQFHTTIRQATFLKGKWWKTLDGRYCWATLPSRIVKLGKVGCVLKDQQDVSTMAYAIAQNIGEVSSQFPLLGAFRSTLVKLSNKVQLDRLHLPKFDFGYSDHRIRNQSFEIDREAAMIDIVARYDITEADIIEMEDLLRGVESLPWYVGHEAFVRLRADYC